MKFTTQYSHTNQRSEFYGTENMEPSLTQESDRNETDINVIMERFNRTGQLPQVQMEAMSGDFSDITDFRDALDRVQAAQAAFMEIPAKIRLQFNNDPAEFIAFAEDPKNIDKLRELGLAEKIEIKDNTPPAPPPDKEEKK